MVRDEKEDRCMSLGGYCSRVGVSFNYTKMINYFPDKKKSKLWLYQKWNNFHLDFILMKNVALHLKTLLIPFVIQRFSVLGKLQILIYK